MLVGGADDLSAADAAAGEEDRSGRTPVIAAAVFVDLRRAAELREEDYQRFAQPAARLQVGEQRGERPIHAGQVVRPLGHLTNVRLLLNRHAMVVPKVAVLRIVTVIDHDEPGPSLDEPASEQAALADLGLAISFSNRFRLLIQFESAANGRRLQHIKCGRILPGDRVAEPGPLDLLQSRLQPLAERVPVGQSPPIQSLGQLERLVQELVFRRLQHFLREVFVPRSAAGEEWIVFTSKPAGGELIGRRGAGPSRPRYGDVTGKAGAPAVQVINDRADVGLGRNLVLRDLAP